MTDANRDLDSGTDERILAAIPLVEPPADFTERVLAAAARTSHSTRGKRNRVAAVLVLALVGAAGFAWWRLATPRNVSGARHTWVVETFAVGRRGVIVAQPDTELEWVVRADGAASVTQRRGNAFYRVEPGGPFQVTTPAGIVLVQGTCFSVEMDPMTSKQKIGAAAIVAGAALVTVYEGHVLVRTEAGERRFVAGESSLMRANEQPAGSEPAEGAEMSREEMTRQLASLRAQVKSLESRLAGITMYGADGSAGPHFFDFSPSELKEMAQRCEVRADLPPFWRRGPLVDADDIARFGLSDSDRAAYERIVATRSAQFLSDVRALHRELTGDDSGGSLELNSLQNEILSKSSEQDHTDAVRRLSQERAGLIPPRDPRQGSIYERYLRLLVRAGDELEREVAREIGPSKARNLRQLGGVIELGGECNP